MKPLNTSQNRVNLACRPVIFAIGCAALALGAKSHAGCSPYDPPKPTAGMERPFGGQTARFMPASFEENSENSAEFTEPHSNYAVVGLWKIKFTSKGNHGIPDGAPIDFGYQTWHSDGTEILNSGMRPPLTSSFCMGVWQRVSYHHYRLNHVTLSWDSSGTVFVGPGTIKEDVVVNERRDAFAGTFEIIQYATDEKTVLADIKGEVTGERISPL